MIKVWDYTDEYESLREEILGEVDSVFRSGTLIFGPKMHAFENAFAAYCECPYGLAVGNCTDAIYIALKALGIGQGDEVITVANTAVPTVTGIVRAGATPKFVDIDEYALMDVPRLRSAITPRTKAIIPVHLFGQTCDMDAINAIAQEHGLKVIEDCAQSHGALYKGKKCGSLGDVGCFSFYPTKVLGAYGDAGFITTNDEELMIRMGRLRFLGMERRKMQGSKWDGEYYCLEHGPDTTNSRMDEVQAAILLVKLKHLDKWILRRREIAEYYAKELADAPIELPWEAPHNRHVYYIYVAHVENRDGLLEWLRQHDVHLNVSYPWPVHTMDGYRYLGGKRGDLPATERKAEAIFSLPMYPQLSLQNQQRTIDLVKQFLHASLAVK